MKGKINYMLLSEIRSKDVFKKLCKVESTGEGNLLHLTETETAAAQIKVLKYFFIKYNPTVFLETGTNQGNFLHLTQEIIKKPIIAYTFDINSGSKEAVSILQEEYPLSSFFFIEGDTKNTLSDFFVRGIDFAWVDGDHNPDGLKSDLYNCDRLRIPVVAVDDIKFFSTYYKDYKLDEIVKKFCDLCGYVVENNPYWEEDSRGIVILKRI